MFAGRVGAESPHNLRMPSTELLIPIPPSSAGRQSSGHQSLDHVPKQKANMREAELHTQNGVGVCHGQESRGNWRPNCPPEAEELVQDLENRGFSLDLVSEFVRRNVEKELPVPGGEGLYIRLCDLSGTPYFGHTHLLRSWQRLYLPRDTKMAVLGTLGSACSMPPFPQWVILVGEDRHLYAYGDEELTLVADSLKTLLQSGLNFTGPTYSYPDASDEDEEILRKDPEVQRIRYRADTFIEESAEDFDDFLDFYDT